MVSTIQKDAPAPPSERREWLRFLRIVFQVTVLPFLLVLGALEWLGWSTGETYTADALVRDLEKYPGMVWMPVRAQALARLKLEEVARERPDVLVMGQSRLAKAQGTMFAPYSGYILARVSWPLNTYAELLRHLPAGYRPKLIIFTVDFWMFSPRYSQVYKDRAPVYNEGIRENLIGIENLAAQVIEHPNLIWRRHDFAGRPARGAAAIETHVAFLRDGSGPTVPPPPFATATTTNNDYFEYLRALDWKEELYPGPAMGQAEMDALKEFVELGHKMGIPIVAVQMPVYGPGLRRIETDPNYGILADFRKHVAAGYFKQIGLPFYDYSTLLPYTEDHRYFYDVIHPGAPLTAAVLASLFATPEVRANLPNIDPARLRAQVEAERTAAQHLEWLPGDEAPHASAP